MDTRHHGTLRTNPPGRMNKHRTHVISVHILRRRARALERELQRDLDNRAGIGWRDVRADLERAGVPPWANGVRVEKAGPFQWALVATEDTGY